MEGNQQFDIITLVAHLPCDVLHDLLVFLPPKDLAIRPMVRNLGITLLEMLPIRSKNAFFSV
ncbi:hypothetical protein PsorP6_013211 [Peronosclerospora sorghi]|uniref:Uncharacterized protein n=1 Tax=Peronosclerospora sorghi TaxID=230839 RepID=A0ACC0WJ35_9STRA|nr:hypothetical protein PsorP6_013211 [Peronosclerospora sorghi]